MCCMHESCRHDGVAVCKDGLCRLLIPKWTPQSHTLDVCLRVCAPSSDRRVFYTWAGSVRVNGNCVYDISDSQSNGCPKVKSFFRQVCCCCFQLLLEMEVGLCDHLRSFKRFGILRQVDLPRADRHSLEGLIVVWRADLLQLLILFA